MSQRNVRRDQSRFSQQLPSDPVERCREIRLCHKSRGAAAFDARNASDRLTGASK